MIMSKLTNEEKNQKLLNLVQENPTLPLVFFVNSEDVCDDYSYTFMKSTTIEKGVIYESEINDNIYTCREEYIEELCDYYADDIEYTNLNNIEYEKEMQNKADKSPHYEAIILYISN